MESKDYQDPCEIYKQFAPSKDKKSKTGPRNNEAETPFVKSHKNSDGFSIGSRLKRFQSDCESCQLQEKPAYLLQNYPQQDQIGDRQHRVKAFDGMFSSAQ